MTPPAHRRRDERGALASSATSVGAAAVVLAAAIFYLATGGPDRGESTASPATSPTTGTPTASVTSSTTPTTLTPTPSPTPTPTATPTPTPTPTPTRTPFDRSTVTVDVYNNTSITGLAATTARQLEKKGWDVGVVGNWRGSIPSTTVYYSRGMKRAATVLARDVDTRRIRPATSDMNKGVLTLILTSAPG